MVEAYIGEVRLFAGTFPPQDWADCNGALLGIADYTALFQLIGTTYGGDGQTTFALPDLRGRVPISQGTGPGLSPRAIGETGGTEAVTLTTPQLPQHSHTVNAATTGQAASPANAFPAGAQSDQAGVRIYSTTTTGTGATTLGTTISPVGNNLPHTNMQPYLGIRYIICLNGYYPSPQ